MIRDTKSPPVPVKHMDSSLIKHYFEYVMGWTLVLLDSWDGWISFSRFLDFSGFLSIGKTAELWRSIR